MLVVGVAKVMSESWSQYLATTLDALQKSSVAEEPQLADRSVAISEVRDRNLAVSEQMHV